MLKIEINDYVIIKDRATKHKMVNYIGIVESVYDNWITVKFDYIPDDMKEYMSDIMFNVNDVKNVSKNKNDLEY